MAVQQNSAVHAKKADKAGELAKGCLGLLVVAGITAVVPELPTALQATMGCAFVVFWAAMWLDARNQQRVADMEEKILDRISDAEIELRMAVADGPIPDRNAHRYL